MVTCEYCKKELNSISSLNYHQKTTVFCLKIQETFKNDNNSEKKEASKELFICEYCKKEFNIKFKLSSHLKNCKYKAVENVKNENEIKLENVKNEYEIKLENVKNEYDIKFENVKNEYEIKLENVKNEYEIKLENNKKELENVKKELEDVKKDFQIKLDITNKEIKLKDDYIQTLKNQLDKYIEKNAVSNNTSIINNNNIVNTVNIREEEYNKCFEAILPMLPRDIKKSMEKINFREMINNVESMDKYFIKSFVENFKVYMFTTDGSRGNIVIKLENGESDKIKAIQFILDCFKIAEPELKRLFIAIQHHIKHLSDIEEITLEQYAQYKANLKDLVTFVSENKSNKFIKKLANELVKCSKIIKNKRLTDNKVLENEILRLT